MPPLELQYRLTKCIAMTNPFELIEARLNSIENLILDLKHQPQQVNPSQAPDKIMTVLEAAEFLKLKPCTVYAGVSKGEIPANKRGNRLYFSSHALMDYVKAGRKLTIADTAAMAGAYLQNKKG
jgi:excisionase family DNA binding protein